MSVPSFSRSQFEHQLADHRALIELINDLEYRVYALGEGNSSEEVTACQQSAGALIGALRTYLFRQDQQVLPVLDTLAGNQGG